MRRKPPDLAIINGTLLNVYTHELWDRCNILVKRNRVAYVGRTSPIDGRYKVIDLAGRIVAPGFIDGHCHIESTMVRPQEYARAVLPHGTTSVFADPHEIANVLGIDGVRMILEEGRHSPLKIFVGVPSSVPASSAAIETTGGSLPLNHLEDLMQDEMVFGLGEMMNYPAVISAEDSFMKKIRLALKSGKVVDGHIPSQGDSELNAYVSSGISSCHETTETDEAISKLRLGMFLMIREGSSMSDTRLTIKPVITGDVDSRRVMLVSDDLNPNDLVKRGHLNYNLKVAVEEGVDPLSAIQMVTLNAAERFGRETDLGGIAPGKVADFVILEDLEEFEPKMVFSDGRLVAKDGKFLFEPSPPRIPSSFYETMNVGRISPGSFEVRVPMNSGKVVARIIRVGKGLLTSKLEEELEVIDGLILPSPESRTAKVCVVERHFATGNIGRGFVRGFGLERGAVAQSIAHDSHNIITLGLADSDMAFAVERIKQLNGGIVAVLNKKVLAEVNLPIAGLLSPNSVKEVAREIEVLLESWRFLGCTHPSPIFPLSGLSLSVVPELRITDKGLVDVARQEIVNVVIH